MSFDKTDTLTRGWPLVTDGVTFTGSGRTMLGAAAAVEGGSDHPVSRAVVERAAADVTAVRPARDRRSLPGQAIEAVVTGKRVIVGSQRHLGGISQATGTVSAVADLERTGKTVVVVVADGVLLGLIAMRDEPPADAVSGIRDLRRMGLRLLILSGDDAPTAQAIGGALNVEVKAELLPADRLREIAALGPLTAGTPQPGGAYRFQVATEMAGTWALTLLAKVQCEAQTIKGTVTFKALK
jgi:Cd2+/Zn2+-exporting ATPase